MNKKAQRVMAVLRPLMVVLTNYPEGAVEWVSIENNPEDPGAGHRSVPFGRELYIEQDDFMEVPIKKFFRLSPGNEVRLKGAYIIKCEEVIKDASGNIVELHCTYDPETRSGGPNAGRKVKGTLHWVEASHAIPAEVRLYEHLFLAEDPENDEDCTDFISKLNPNSLQVLENCLVEPALAEARVGDRFQFLRHGYFCVDPDTAPGALVFNRIVSLRDTWAKIKKSAQ